MAEEESKIMNAEVWSDGKYVYFVILGDAEKSSVNEAFKSMMKKEPAVSRFSDMYNHKT